jgi:hypothetical protein
LTRIPSIAMLVTVSHARQNSRKSSRPPRIRVPNNEQAVFTLENRTVLGVIKRISLTGGSAILARKGPAPQGSLGEMCLNTIYGKVTAQVEFLHTGADGIPHAQAFRFLEMDNVSRKRFTAAAKQMQLAGFSDAEERQTLGWASRGLTALTKSVRRIVGGAKKTQ